MSFDAPTTAVLQQLLERVSIVPDLVVHGTDGSPPEGTELVDRSLLTPAAVRGLVSSVQAGIASGELQPLCAIAFCHLLPTIDGQVLLPCLLPLLTPSIEDLNIDGQPLELSEARAILSALQALPARRSLITISLINCGVQRAALTEGFPAALLEGLQIYLPDPLPFRVLTCDCALEAAALPAPPLALQACTPADLPTHLASATSPSWDAILLSLGSAGDAPALQAALRTARQRHPAAFLAVLLPAAPPPLALRLALFRSGARMLAADAAAAGAGLCAAAALARSSGGLTCPLCAAHSLLPAALAAHLPLYHGAEPPPPQALAALPCPACHLPAAAFPYGSLAVHMHESHSAAARGRRGLLPPPPPPRPALAAFAWVVCRCPATGLFLLVHEPAALCSASGAPALWLPAGRVDPGEGLVAAGVREALEEAGVAVAVTGLLRATLSEGGRVLRVVLLAQPLALAQQPKSLPDFESCGACWGSAEEVRALAAEDLRSSHPAELLPGVESGELAAVGLDTEAWRRLEGLVELMAGQEEGRAGGGSMAEVWEAMKATYPGLCMRG